MLFDNYIRSKTTRLVENQFNGQATKGLCRDDLVRWGEEGRGKHRYVPGSRKQALIREIPNGETHRELYRDIPLMNSIVLGKRNQENWNI